MKCFSDFGISSRREDEQGLELLVSWLDESHNYLPALRFPPGYYFTSFQGFKELLK
jgi:hypothetical protein